MIAKFPEIELLSLDERMALVQELCEGIWAEESALPSEETFVAEMERRAAVAEADPEKLMSWDEAMAARGGR